MTTQPSILLGVPAHASFLLLDLRQPQDHAAAAQQLAALCPSELLLIGLGSGLLSAWGATPPGMGPMPALSGPAGASPRTPADLFLRIGGDDPGAVLHRERAVLKALPAFAVRDQVAGFVFGDSHDLTDFEDGTENPSGDHAARVAISQAPGHVGGSVLAYQRWLHDLDAFEALSPTQQHHAIGRHRTTNVELDDAPASAHVKRTAQEDFSPEAFLLRRSMPWRDARGAGLVFLSFSASLQPFEAQLRRMMGLDDGIVDAIYAFTRPLSGACFWCPPMHQGLLDLRNLRPQP